MRKIIQLVCFELLVGSAQATIIYNSKINEVLRRFPTKKVSCATRILPYHLNHVFTLSFWLDAVHTHWIVVSHVTGRTVCCV